MEGELQRRVGRRLRACRIERGLSQEAFADVLQVHRTYMGGIERGERNLTLKSVERIAERLGVDPLWLLNEDDGPLSRRVQAGAATRPAQPDEQGRARRRGRPDRAGGPGQRR